MKRIVMLCAIALIAVTVSGCNLKSALTNRSKTISQEEAKTKTVDFIKNSLLPPGSEVEAKEVVEESGMYKIKLGLKMEGKEQPDVEIYVTKDGKMFFPTMAGVKIEEKAKTDAPAQPTAGAEQKEMVKSDKPEVKLFVMSYCPFGTQIEKGIIPVVEALGSKINFKLEFVSYTMHGDKEAEENMRQYCIDKNSPAKLLGYLKCFLKTKEGGAEEADKCMATLGISKATIDSCIKASNEKFAVKAGETAFNVNKEDNDKYGVQGSPTLVINGVTSSAGRDSASLLKAICGAFKNEPAECKKELSSTAPSAGFGEGTGSNSDASCGS